jgi:thiol:disulfide interchange protein
MHALHFTKRLFASVLAIALAAVVAWADEPPPKLNLSELITSKPGAKDVEPVTLTATFKVEKDSRRGALSITALIEPTYHVFSVTQPAGGPMRTRIAVTETDQFKLLDKNFQPDKPPHVKPPTADGFKVISEEHEEQVTWTAPMELAEGVDPAKLEIAINYSGQVCDPSSCRQVFKKLTAKFGGYAAVPTKSIDIKGLLPIVGFGFLGGLILNLMPCVLPVIGLKLLSFAQQGGESRGRIFALNAWFAAGLMLVFLLLATASAFGSYFLGENLSWGQQFTYTEFKVAMVVIVFAFALSFLGVWEVPIPGFAQSTASSKLQQKEGPAGAFFKGVFTTLLATPCSGPFLGPVFAYTLAQPAIVTYVIFASVGLGMAAPYLVIGAFPALVRWLPKPGEWMDTVKQLMGFVLLGTVVYLFITINRDYFIPTLALIVGVWFACWWIGKVPVYESTGKQLWAWLGGSAAAALIGYLAFTYLGPAKELLEWRPYTAESLAQFRAEGKTVMLDFTADWCLTCQLNTNRAIETPRVKEVVEKHGIVPMLADWTDKNDAIKNKLAELNQDSIPFLVIYPAGKPDEVIALSDVITERQLIDALEKAGPSKPAATAAAATAEAAKAGQPSG